jgi:hypothetical protein
MNGERTNGERTNGVSQLRIRFSLITVPLGMLIFTIGAKPEWYGLSGTQVVGFIQISVFLVGLALICFGGFIGVSALWGKEQRSIVADIGIRLVATGYVITIFTGLADVFGMGSQALPKTPYFGPWQAGGVVIGEIVIAIGFLMVIPYRLYFSRIRR